MQILLLVGCALTGLAYANIVAWVFDLELSALMSVLAGLVGAVAGFVLSALLAGR